MADHARQPACEGCPLAGQKKVWGEGSLDKEWLLVGEAPGPDEEADGRPFVGPSGWLLESLGLIPAKLKRASIRIENVNQCRAPAESPRGRQAQKHCGPSLLDVVQAMPHLKWIIALGDPALRWISGHAEWELGARAARTASKAYEHRQVSYAKKVARYEQRWHDWQVKANARLAAGKKPLKEPKPLEAIVLESPQPVAPDPGFEGITQWRGSPLSLKLDGRTFTLFPIMHPASVMAFRQPRLRPLLTLDFIKAAKLARGDLASPPYTTTLVRSAPELEAWFAGTPLGRIALDIEWSLQLGTLQCIGIGRADRYALIMWRELTDPSVLSAIHAVLQREFTNPLRLWGGHFVSGYDERKLAEVGFTLKCDWDSLYGFHVCFAELGSPRDEENDDLTQASGYDLGFVASVLTCDPYHKGVVTHERDAATVEASELYAYCVKDVRASWLAMGEIEREMDARWTIRATPYALMHADMERTRRATWTGLDGLPVLNDRRKLAVEWLTAKLATLEEAARTVVGDPAFNPHSLPQLASALQAQGVKLRALTKTGLPRLDAKVVENLVGAHPTNPLLASIGELRSAQKDLGVYAGLEPRSIAGTVPVSWKVHGTVGPRWSSNPNVQNLTAEQKSIVGALGMRVIVGDLDAAELRIAALIAGERDLLAAIDTPGAESPHYETARQLFGRADKREWPVEYRFAKSALYRWIYTLPDESVNLEGGNLRTNLVDVQPTSLIRLTGWFNRKFRAIVQWKRQTIAQLLASGFSRSPQGRLRDLRWATLSKMKKLVHHAQRAALNFPVQSCVAEVVGDAFVEAYERCQGTPMRVFANEHDSLAILAPPDWECDAVLILQIALGRPIPELHYYRIPVQIKVGDSWGEDE